MNTFVLVLCFATAALAGSYEYAEYAPFDLKHTADLDGSYTFSYSSADSSRTETRSPHGDISGAYSYIDDSGVLQKVQYIADGAGVQVSGTNLPGGAPVPVQDTPEVVAATAEHFALVDEQLKKLAIAHKLEAEYKAAHPESIEEYHYVAPVVHHVQPAPQYAAPAPHYVYYNFVEHHDEVPVAPEDDEDVKIARAEHLAEVERITAEHYAALAAAAN